ncbi:glycosyltransferase family 2 protein [Croceicoccus hydrothermalis]|uniref:glycosyltransferase family 2 protein n=1 Tax=Croceicoccus hydrothermalis TaxID=2867964 RepID=UPI001EFA994D|nr:glycosyltransferase family A protein [Croceicoccus hydrothermalis]
MTAPFFSVVIAAFNAERTIAEAIDSVLAQTEQDFEIIVIDDGSTDGTLLAAMKRAETDDRIKLISRNNSGVSAARNCGVGNSRGRMLAFLDADDAWHPEKLETHRRLHEADNTLAASFARIAFCPDSTDALRPGRTVSTVTGKDCTLNDVVIENAVCTMSNLVVSHAAFAMVGRFDETMRYVEDQDLLARLVGGGYRLCGIDETLVFYRLSENGLSCDFSAMFDAWHGLAARWADRIDLRRGEALYCRYLARRTLRAGGHARRARRFVKQGLRSDPRAFMSGGMRGALTAAGALFGDVVPVSARTTIFA